MTSDTETKPARRFLGLSVRLDGAKLFVSPAALIDDDVSWLIRTHKTEIVRELQNDSPSWAWLVRFDGTAKEVYRHPPATRAEVLERYADALVAEPFEPKSKCGQAPLGHCPWCTNPMQLPSTSCSKLPKKRGNLPSSRRLVVAPATSRNATYLNALRTIRLCRRYDLIND